MKILKASEGEISTGEFGSANFCSMYKYAANQGAKAILVVRKVQSNVGSAIYRVKVVWSWAGRGC